MPVFQSPVLSQHWSWILLDASIQAYRSSLCHEMIFVFYPGMCYTTLWKRNIPKCWSSLIHSLEKSIFFLVCPKGRNAVTMPGNGVLQMQKLKIHLLRTQSSMDFPFKPGADLYIAMHATPTAKDFFLVNFYPVVHSLERFLKPLLSFSYTGCD